MQHIHSTISYNNKIIITRVISVWLEGLLRRSLLDTDSILYSLFIHFNNTLRFFWINSSLLFLLCSRAEEAWRSEAAAAPKPFLIAPLMLFLYIIGKMKSANFLIKEIDVSFPSLRSFAVLYQTSLFYLFLYILWVTVVISFEFKSESFLINTEDNASWLPRLPWNHWTVLLDESKSSNF